MIDVSEAPPASGRTDEAMVESLVAGDSAALAALYDRYGRLAFYVASRILGDSAAAEDVVQDVFVSIWKHAASFDPARGSVRTWLLTSVRHRSIDLLRGHPTSQLDVVDEPAGFAPADETWVSVGSRIEAAEVRRALISLPEDQRLMIYLNYYRDMTHPQIASQLRIPLGTVKGRIRLAMAKLRKSFNTLDGVAASA
jgi:RNA polymerase sigma-70 factor (ECF subfamily)